MGAAFVRFICPQCGSADVVIGEDGFCTCQKCWRWGAKRKFAKQTASSNKDFQRESQSVPHHNRRGSRRRDDDVE